MPNFSLLVAISNFCRMLKQSLCHFAILRLLADDDNTEEGEMTFAIVLVVRCSACTGMTESVSLVNEVCAGVSSASSKN